MVSTQSKKITVVKKVGFEKSRQNLWWTEPQNRQKTTCRVVKNSRVLSGYLYDIGFNPSEKYARQNGFIFPNFRDGKIQKYLSCHHLALRPSDSLEDNFLLNFTLLILMSRMPFPSYNLWIVLAIFFFPSQKTWGHYMNPNFLHDLFIFFSGKSGKPWKTL